MNSRADRPTLAALLLMAAISAPAVLAAQVPQIKAGDTIVVLYDTHVQAGTEKLTPVEAGRELVAGEVRGQWVSVGIEKQRETIKGWIQGRSVLSDPQGQFAALIAEGTSDRIDTKKDGFLTANEFLDSTRKPLLDDLNEQLRRSMNSPAGSRYRELLRGRGRIEGALMVEHLKWVGMVRKFGVWNRTITLDEAYQLVDDFAKTGDIRRSRLAQELVDREDPKRRAQRAQALFKWADRNGDGKLTLEEFKQALPQRTEGEQR